jgi:hypothetical protein
MTKGTFVARALRAISLGALISLLIAVSAWTAGAASAEATNDSDVTMDRDFSFVEFDPCPGAADLVLLEGHNHIVIHMTTDSNLGVHTMTITMDAHGKGVGLDEFLLPIPDVTYSVMDTQKATVNVPSGASSEATTDLYLRVVRNQETLLPDDFFWHVLVHATVVRDLPVVTFEKGEPKCA